MLDFSDGFTTPHPSIRYFWFLGSQIQSVINMISTVLDDNETKAFLDSHGIRNIDYHLYPKGNSYLDSLVETPVKPE